MKFLLNFELKSTGVYLFYTHVEVHYELATLHLFWSGKVIGSLKNPFVWSSRSSSHLEKGPSINQVDRFFGYFWPIPSTWTLLFNKSYDVKWSFGLIPLPLNYPCGLWIPLKAQLKYAFHNEFFGEYPTNSLLRQ